MVTIKQIKALILMSIMGLMVLHDVFPHVHSDEVLGAFGELFSSGEHAHGHHHHHGTVNPSEPDSQKEEQEQNSWLFFFLENHGHYLHAHEFVGLISGNPLQRLEKIPFVCEAPATKSLSPPGVSRHLHRYSLFDPPFYEDPLLACRNLRAPPV